MIHTVKGFDIVNKAEIDVFFWNSLFFWFCFLHFFFYLSIFQFVVIHTVKDFDIVNKAEIDVFLELSCFFRDPADVGNLITGSSLTRSNKA